MQIPKKGNDVMSVLDLESSVIRLASKYNATFSTRWRF
jgi:hypothetical protein